MASNRTPLLSKILASTDTSNPDVCWLWPGAKTSGGYGSLHVKVNGRSTTTTVHRAVFVEMNGPLDDDLHVCHTCDNPPCFNPAHLFAGTVTENQRDSANKGRHINPVRHNEAHGMCKLSNDAVCDIRKRYAAGDVTQSSLAIEYGVGQNQISRIVRGENRKL